MIKVTKVEQTNRKNFTHQFPSTTINGEEGHRLVGLSKEAVEVLQEEAESDSIFVVEVDLKIIEVDRNKVLLFVETTQEGDFKATEDHLIAEDRQSEEFPPFVECHFPIKEDFRVVDIHR